MAIVTISYEMGTAGPEIGERLAQRLGYRYVDHELIAEAARRYGLLEEKLAHLEESKPSLFERFDSETRRYITVLQTVLYEFAEADNVVLMRRGGQWLLRGIPHVLRVQVMAPFALRVKRLSATLAGQGGEATNPRLVAEMVRRGDAEIAGRMRYLYEVDVRNPALYDVTINEEQFGREVAVEVLAALLGRPELTTTERGRQVVADRSLASRVQVALATHPQTLRQRFTVEAASGVVTLEGTGDLERAAEVARGVRGVREVQTRPVEIPPIPPFVA
jgi:cytidylate kinase